jgi:phosphoenolpyruvate carboxylase
MPKKPDEQFSKDVTAERRDAVIKHMLSTPPKPHSEMKIGKRSSKTKQKKAIIESFRLAIPWRF